MTTFRAAQGRIASPDAESGLARTAWVLAACAGMHRSVQIDQRLARALVDGGTANDLWEIPTESTVQELADLARRLHTSRVEDQLCSLADHPPPGHRLGVAAPALVPGRAVGDLWSAPSRRAH